MIPWDLEKEWEREFHDLLAPCHNALLEGDFSKQPSPSYREYTFLLLYDVMQWAEASGIRIQTMLSDCFHPTGDLLFQSFRIPVGSVWFYPQDGTKEVYIYGSDGQVTLGQEGGTKPSSWYMDMFQEYVYQKLQLTLEDLEPIKTEDTLQFRNLLYGTLDLKVRRFSGPVIDRRHIPPLDTIGCASLLFDEAREAYRRYRQQPGRQNTRLTIPVDVVLISGDLYGVYGIPEISQILEQKLSQLSYGIVPEVSSTPRLRKATSASILRSNMKIIQEWLEKYFMTRSAFHCSEIEYLQRWHVPRYTSVHLETLGTLPYPHVVNIEIRARFGIHEVTPAGLLLVHGMILYARLFEWSQHLRKRHHRSMFSKYIRRRQREYILFYLSREKSSVNKDGVKALFKDVLEDPAING